MAPERLYSPEEVAEYLQVHRETVMENLRSARLRGRKVGRLWRISESDLQAYIDAYTNQPGRLGRLMWDDLPAEAIPPFPTESEEED
jgi:excisionase family DNA binding protein